MFDNNPEEHYLKQDDPQKPTYYIIRHMSDSLELSDIYRLTAGHIWYALSKSWLPVVDMQNYPNAFLLPENLGKENSWEYYFEQPLRIGLKQAYDGDNVVLSDGFTVKSYPDYSSNFLEKKDDSLAEWRMLVKWGFLKMKPDLESSITGMREELFLSKERVMGVLLRGKIPNDKKTPGQPVAPSAEFAAKVAEVKFKEWKCDKIFLVTEDFAVKEVFKNKFSDECIILDQLDAECYDSDTTIELENTTPENELFALGKKYLTQTALLSGCNSLVAEKCVNAVNVMLMASKLTNTYFFNLGVYGMMNF